MKRSRQRLFIEAFPLLGDAPSGVGKLLYSMIDALVGNEAFARNYEIVLVVSLRKKHQLDKWNFNQLKVKVIPLPLRVINLLDRFHLMFPIDLVCGKGIYLFPNYRRLPLLRSRSITYIHDISYLLYPDTVQERNLSFLHRTVPRSIKYSDRVVTLSEQSANELKGVFTRYETKVMIVPAGVDKSRYVVRNAKKEVIANTLSTVGVKSGKYILFVGNIEPRKNINYLIDIYIHLKKDPAYGDLALLLVGGDGWRNGAILRRINELNAAGYKILRPSKRVPDKDLPVLYKESLVTALMAVYEGFGMTPLEALAAGARVVVSDIPVLHEVGGNAVTYATLDDSAKAAHAFKEATKAKVNTKEVDAQLNMYTWKHAASQLLKVIDEVSTSKVRRR